jgi:hypothetical protein
MDSSYLFGLAKRFLAIADDCLDRPVKDELVEIAEDLIRKANELERLKPRLGVAQSAAQARRLHS